MAKGGGTQSTNLLRICGLIFSVAGTLHVVRYFRGWEFRLGSFQLTLLGSLIVGSLLLLLAAACFANARQ